VVTKTENATTSPLVFKNGFVRMIRILSCEIAVVIACGYGGLGIAMGAAEEEDRVNP
jgi:hypothetical protein